MNNLPTAPQSSLTLRTRLKNRAPHPQLRLSSREKLLLGLFFFLSAAALYYFLVLNKQIKQINYLESQIAQRDEIVCEMYGKGFHKISDMENKIKEHEQMIAQIYTMVPNIKDTPGLLVDIYYLLSKHYLSAENVTFGQLQEHQNYNTFIVDLNIKGTASNIQNFLKDMENYKRAVTINKLAFTPAEGDILETYIGLTVFVMHDIEPDPLDYPFMSGQYGRESPFDIFVYPGPEEKREGETKESSDLPLNNPADIWKSLSESIQPEGKKEE